MIPSITGDAGSWKPICQGEDESKPVKKLLGNRELEKEEIIDYYIFKIRRM